jgi:serine/threonine protein kinase
MSLIPIDPRTIAVASDLLPPDSVAPVRLDAQPSARGGEIVRLHHEEIGTYARVFSARWREGGAWRVVAVKLQRDEVASDFAYDHQIVAAKFDEELASHLELERRRAARDRIRAGPLPIVRLLRRPAHGAGAASSATPPCEVLPPCLFCLKARHALRLRCRGGQLLQPGPPSGSQRYLEPAGPGDGGARYYYDHLDDVARATVGNDPTACASCELRDGQDPDACLAHVRFVNLFENRILFFERMDLSLHDALRWWSGERRPPPPRARRAMRAIEARRRRRARSGDAEALNPLLDLRLRVGLFSQALRGVEVLHARGIPHLDLNPENICLRVRSGRVEARLIDLGMAVNPDHTARDQHEKRLWPRRADFAADECLRLGIFTSRSVFVPVGSGRLATRVPVCRGDQLELASPGAPGRVAVFEVRSVAAWGDRVPGYGTFPFVCEVDGGPEDGAPSAAMELKVVPHRGPAADVFSLGMILASLLGNDPGGDELRRDLAPIEESLAAHWREAGPDPLPIPGRALVWRVLSRPDEHTRRFRERIEAFGAYDVATPLAEELLGIALRALIRAPHHHAYLPDRGGDARLALRRLGADVRAVRRALDGDLVMLRGRETLNGRRAALRGLAERSGIEIAPVLPEPVAAGGEAIVSDSTSLQHAIRMIAADPGRPVVEPWPITRWTASASQIAEMMLALDPILDAESPRQFSRTRALWDFLEWLRQPDLDNDLTGRFLACWEQGRRRVGPIARWRDRHRTLAHDLARSVGASRLLGEALAIFDHRVGREVVKLWRRALGWQVIAIPAEEYRVLARALEAVDRLDALRIGSDDLACRLRDRFEGALGRWRQLGEGWCQAWMGEPTRRASDFWMVRLPEAQASWSREQADALARLRSLFETLREVTADVRERRGRVLVTLAGPPSQALPGRRAEVVGDPVATTAPGPAHGAEADAALCRLFAFDVARLDISQDGPDEASPEAAPDPIPVNHDHASSGLAS